MSTASAPPEQPARKSLLPDARHRAKVRRWRSFKDGVSKYGISLAGISVVLALTLIFVYLFSEVGPLFSSASLEHRNSYETEGVEAPVVYTSLERYNELALMVTADGVLRFTDTDDGTVRLEKRTQLADGVRVSAFAAGNPRSGLLLFGLDNGKGVVVQHDYSLSYPNDQREITPEVLYPLGEKPLLLDTGGGELAQVAIQEGRSGTAIAALTTDNQLSLNVFATRTNFMTGEKEIKRNSYTLPVPSDTALTKLLLDDSLRNLYAADDQGFIHHYDIADPAKAERVGSVKVVGKNQSITALSFLAGTVSLVVGSSDGSLSQWFLVRDNEGVNRFSLTHIRDFEKHPAAIKAIAQEYTRKGFVALDENNHLGIHYGTSARTLYLKPLAENLAGNRLAISPINTALLVQGSGNRAHFFDLQNAHPDVSWKAMWNAVWYEGRQQPEYVWQASSGSDTFEPKMSLVPLTIGTLKAAFFAMLFAMPLAIMGAIYTAYFMSPKLRGQVKPTIEIMEALPTVILGFLAGLWLAPFLENNLPAVFSILLLMPVSMLLMAWIWHCLPASWRERVGPGWEVAILMPVVLLTGWFCVAASPHIEQAFFNGSMRQWFTDIGVTYDQRNALVVGIAMGFAVIPTIFSIAEDAIFNVPKHLTQGSLALGATPWQTLTRVVLLTASPGIFSAVMVGFGRAVGETMIVLMATGNSPVMNFNIFEGMRTLSANIAVELPETAVGSSHFRVLFLAALVLFVLTFVANTVAEVVRQRLRQRYSSL